MDVLCVFRKGSLLPTTSRAVLKATRHRSRTSARAGYAPEAREHREWDQPDVEQCTLPSGLVDYYRLLQVNEEASSAEMKAAYRALQKVCHPDVTGQDRLSVLLNEAYAILSDETLRSLYDIDLKETLWEKEQGFTNRPLSEWVPHTAPHCAKNTDPDETRALFVDEHTCIGCNRCTWAGARTFELEPEHGRARVVRQWADAEEDLQAAVDVCPVSCIHWIHRDQLPILEHVMRKHAPRMNVGIMMGSALQRPSINVFHEARVFEQHEAQRSKAHASWRQVYKYSQQQEDAMAAARGGLSGFMFTSSLSMVGKLVAVFAALSKAIYNAMGQVQAASLPEETHEPIPFERSLVRVRIDDK